MQIRRGQTMRWNGIAVRVIDVDSDPAANVWICEIDNPDADHMVPRSELS